MDMNDDWAKLLSERGIKFKEEKDHIIFYDPIEGTIRRHNKNDKHFEFYSYRIGIIDKEAFDRIPESTRYDYSKFCD